VVQERRQLLQVARPQFRRFVAYGTGLPNIRDIGIMENSHFRKAALALLIASTVLRPYLLKAEEEDHHANAETRLDVVVADDGTVESIRHLWRMDPGFTGTLLDEFDLNGNGLLDTAELDEIGPVIEKSIAGYDYFRMVTRNGLDVDMAPPDQFLVDVRDGQIIILFQAKPATPLLLEGTLAFGVYDPTFHTFFTVGDHSYMSVLPKPSNCTERIIRPDADAEMKLHDKAVARALSGDSVETGLIKVFATRLELNCRPQD
jgi:ABC-type uncharacterized transport system substrate-binding protein